MATITSDIGGGGEDYATLALWEASIPGAISDHYQAMLYTTNGATIDVGTGVVIAARTGNSATNYIEITVAAGHSFVDNFDPETDPLRADAAYGVMLYSDDTSAYCVRNQGNSFFRMSRVQVQWDTPNNYSNYCIGSEGGSSGSSSFFDQIMVEAINDAGKTFLFQSEGTASRFTNCLVILNTSFGNLNGYQNSFGGSYVNCTAVRPSSATGNTTGFRLGYGSFTTTVDNCVAMGFSDADHSFLDSAGTMAGDWNATDQSTCNIGGANDLVSLTFADQFDSITSAAPDFRLKTGHDLAVGPLDADRGGVDIVGTTLPGSNVCIGCAEFVTHGGGGGSTILPLMNHYLG